MCSLVNSLLDRHRFAAYPDPTFQFDADPDQDPIPDPGSTPGFTLVRNQIKKKTFTAAPVYIHGFIFLLIVTGFIIFIKYFSFAFG